MSGSVAADIAPDRHDEAQMVQTPVQTSRGKTTYLQVGSNPVCASNRLSARPARIGAWLLTAGRSAKDRSMVPWS